MSAAALSSVRGRTRCAACARRRADRAARGRRAAIRPRAMRCCGADRAFSARTWTRSRGSRRGSRAPSPTRCAGRRCRPTCFASRASRATTPREDVRVFRTLGHDRGRTRAASAARPVALRPRGARGGAARAVSGSRADAADRARGARRARRPTRRSRTCSSASATGSARARARTCCGAARSTRRGSSASCARRSAKGSPSRCSALRSRSCTPRMRSATARFALPAGSRIMQTGGFKGRTREVAPAEMLRAAGAALRRARAVHRAGVRHDRAQLAALREHAARSGARARARAAAAAGAGLDAREPGGPRDAWRRSRPARWGCVRIDDLANVDSGLRDPDRRSRAGRAGRHRACSAAQRARRRAAARSRSTPRSVAALAARDAMTATRERARTLREQVLRVADAGAALRALPIDARARAIERAARLLLARRQRARARAARSAAREQRAQRRGDRARAATTLALFEADALRALHASAAGAGAPRGARGGRARRQRVQRGGAPAALRRCFAATAWWPRPRRATTALPAAACSARSPRPSRASARRARAVAFPHTDAALLDALLAGAQPWRAYGGDATMAALRARIAKAVPLIAHGHGLGLAAIGARRAPRPAAARELAARLALDVAAYDQRGCLSPHAVLVESGGAVGSRCLRARARRRARRSSSRTLAARRRSRPTPRATSCSGAASPPRVHELHEGATFAVSYEGRSRAAARARATATSPCTRCADLERAARASSPRLGPHLKALGVAGARRAARNSRASRPTPARSAQMQTPPLDARARRPAPARGLLTLAIGYTPMNRRWAKLRSRLRAKIFVGGGLDVVLDALELEALRVACRRPCSSRGCRSRAAGRPSRR